MQGVSDCNSTWPAGFWSNPTWTGPIWVLLFCEWGLWILTIKSETVWSSLSLRKYSLFEKQCLVLAKTTSYHAHCLFFFFFFDKTIMYMLEISFGLYWLEKKDPSQRGPCGRRINTKIKHRRNIYSSVCWQKNKHHLNYWIYMYYCLFESKGDLL